MKGLWKDKDKHFVKDNLKQYQKNILKKDFKNMIFENEVILVKEKNKYVSEKILCDILFEDNIVRAWKYDNCFFDENFENLLSSNGKYNSKFYDGEYSYYIQKDIVIKNIITKEVDIFYSESRNYYLHEDFFKYKQKIYLKSTKKLLDKRLYSFYKYRGGMCSFREDITKEKIKLNKLKNLYIPSNLNLVSDSIDKIESELYNSKRKFINYYD